ncbi:Pentatricopeptide repeat-containing protein [Apostasia shenzhenica]|uniref:Pentatricopeptide repeat-containing protein n=1 Tax=Apostasia shenzhenica TaxID=1088818 RepID=A0A2I0A1M7_9ASPA|nr:Pentatricopeptide repeat-containing protein [Apostasia shenzhenica]
MTEWFFRKTLAFSTWDHLRHPFLSFLEKYPNADRLKRIHAHALTAGLSRFAYITSRILACYVEIGDIHEASQLFGRIPSPTIFNWNTMIRGFSKSPEPHKGFLIYNQMRRCSVYPNMHTFPFTVKACAHLLSLFQVHAQIFILGFDPDVYVTSSLIRSYSDLEGMEFACRVFDQCSNRNVVCWTSLISGYCSHGLLDRARAVFDEMPIKNDASWSAIFAGYVQNKRHEEAMELFRGLLKVPESAKLNRSLLVSALSASAALGAYDEGRWIHSYVDCHGFQYCPELGTALLDFYAKCGLVQRAREVFEKMPIKDVAAWTAMIMGLAVNGYSHSAVHLFSEMLSDKKKPNAITFIGLLTACNHGGLIDEGRARFREMTTVYGISPSIEHYGCMVDLLSRAGKTKEAEKMIMDMPMEPDGAIWGALLNGCFVHGDIELGERVGRHLIKLEPDRYGRYVGLANVYAAMGRWEGVADVRRAMKEKGVIATSGWSLIEFDGVTHRFLANDNIHPMLDEIYQMLCDLNMEMLLNC